MTINRLDNKHYNIDGSLNVVHDGSWEGFTYGGMSFVSRKIEQPNLPNTQIKVYVDRVVSIVAVLSLIGVCFLFMSNNNRSQSNHGRVYEYTKLATS